MNDSIATTLASIRKLLDDYTPGLPLERTQLRDSLSTPAADPAVERERLFALGWGHWLNDEPEAAESLFTQALQAACEQNALEALAESAYWKTRVGLHLGRGEGLPEFENVLRSLGGSPRATVGFVDLLGRAGQVDRAEQVWKSVRGNRRVMSCAEGPLLEARFLLQRGDLATAERLLGEMNPNNGVVWVECLLLLAWIATSRSQADEARRLLQQAQDGPYPLSALQSWKKHVEQRLAEAEKPTELLHQAARALGRKDALQARAFIQRALAVDPHLTDVPNASLVFAAAAELERRACAQSLARALERSDESAATLAGVVQALADEPGGQTVLDALKQGDPATARVRLDTLAEQTTLPPRLAHHLALLMQQAALDREKSEDMAASEKYWRRAWLCWLRFLVADAVETEARRMLLDWLLAQHRQRLNQLLARDAIADARRYWLLLRELPGIGVGIDERLGLDLAKRIELFRDELATEYLLTTREAMRYGVVPEGWRADYEKGLLYLRRLLSLDSDNPRLLAALVEICNDWFVDLYHLLDAAMLRKQLDRFTPFALHLARRIDDRPGDLSARAALSVFWKFRGFLAPDREQKAALYREALRFNPANDNARELLAGMNADS